MGFSALSFDMNLRVYDTPYSAPTAEVNSSESPGNTPGSTSPSIIANCMAGTRTNEHSLVAGRYRYFSCFLRSSFSGTPPAIVLPPSRRLGVPFIILTLPDACRNQRRRPNLYHVRRLARSRTGLVLGCRGQDLAVGWPIREDQPSAPRALSLAPGHDEAKEEP